MKQHHTILYCYWLCYLLLDGAFVSSFVLPRDHFSSSSSSYTSNTVVRRHLSIEDSWSDLATKLPTADINYNTKYIEKIVDEFPTDITINVEWFAIPATYAAKQIQVFQQLPTVAQATILVTPFLLTIFTILYQLSFPPGNYRTDIEPYTRGNYDPVQAQAYYAKKHPKVVFQRGLQLFRLSNRFLIGLLLDKYVFRDSEKPTKKKQRASELLKLITTLGPTAIKVGQALSVRQDIISQEYAEALSTLQDRVPPFSNSEAKRILQQELGLEKYELLKGINNASPVASASIGQVYKATIDDGTNREVAIKVQRPNALAEISLDLYLVREVLPYYTKYIVKSQTDFQKLANEWGRGFIAELDYRQEATKTMEFNLEMSKRNLGAVTAPVVLEEFSTEQVLVTEWIDGTRIDQSDEADIPRLCSVALNAYLIMLLELQSLHCDPHPGNLLRTNDGRLCILDFGMTLDVDPTLQYSLLEYIAHCTSDNYDKTPEDLVNMGFLKPERLDYVKRSGVLEPLVYFLREAGKGGGAKGVRERVIADFRSRYPGLSDDEIRVAARDEMMAQREESAKRESVATGITVEVEELQKRNRDSFIIPEWFVYTSRAFITLEGVSLQADPDYSLIQSCFPYIAKRLLKDDSPRAQKALKELLYGAGDLVDVEQIANLAEGFSTYTTTTKTLSSPSQANITSSVESGVGFGGGGNLVPTRTKTTPSPTNKNKDSKQKKVEEAEAVITLAKDSADVLLDPKGNLIQNLLVEEGALAASARFKDSVKNSLVDGPQRFRDSLPLGVGNVLPPLPFEDAIAPFVKKTQEEKRAELLVEKIGTLVSANARNGGGVGGEPSIAQGQLFSSSTAADNNNNNNNQSQQQQTLNALVNDLEPEQAALILKELRENLPNYTGLLRQLGTKFVGKLLEKASENIETTLEEIETTTTTDNNNLRVGDELLAVAARGVAGVAQRGAKTIRERSSSSTTTTTKGG